MEPFAGFQYEYETACFKPFLHLDADLPAILRLPAEEGACAALYAARHPEALDGVVLLAAFATRPLDDGLSVLSVYGTEDGVLHMDRYQKCLDNLPAQTTELVIEGGNHAQFGSYGNQKGDGAARITREDQIEETAAAIAAMVQEIH